MSIEDPFVCHVAELILAKKREPLSFTCVFSQLLFFYLLRLSGAISLTEGLIKSNKSYSQLDPV